MNINKGYIQLLIEFFFYLIDYLQLIHIENHK